MGKRAVRERWGRRAEVAEEKVSAEMQAREWRVDTGRGDTQSPWLDSVPLVLQSLRPQGRKGVESSSPQG